MHMIMITTVTGVGFSYDYSEFTPGSSCSDEDEAFKQHQEY